MNYTKIVRRAASVAREAATPKERPTGSGGVSPLRAPRLAGNIRHVGLRFAFSQERLVCSRRNAKHGRAKNRAETALSSQEKTGQTQSEISDREGRTRKGKPSTEDPHSKPLVDRTTGGEALTENRVELAWLGRMERSRRHPGERLASRLHFRDSRKRDVGCSYAAEGPGRSPGVE